MPDTDSIAHPVLGVAVLQWNASHHTIALLEDLHDTPCTIAVCDNGSDTAHLKALLAYLHAGSEEIADESRTAGEQLTIMLQNRYNSGFAAGMNLCIQALLEQSIDWVWILNNDTRVAAGTVEAMLEAIENLEHGFYGTAMCEQKSGQRSYGNVYNMWTSRYHPVTKFYDGIENQGDWYPDGASMLIHREVFKKVGLLSEDYFIYFEELDFKRRIALQEYQPKLLPEVEVKHVQAGSSSQSSFSSLRMYHETLSTLTFYKKHHRYYLPVVLLLRTPIRLLSLLVKGRYSEMRPVLRATAHFLSSNHQAFSPPGVSLKRYFFSRHAD